MINDKEKLFRACHFLSKEQIESIPGLSEFYKNEKKDNYSYNLKKMENVLIREFKKLKTKVTPKLFLEKIKEPKHHTHIKEGALTSLVKTGVFSISNNWKLSLNEEVIKQKRESYGKHY